MGKIGALHVAATLGIEVYELDDLTHRAQCMRVGGLWTVYVKSGLGREQRDRAIFAMLARIRQKALASARSEPLQTLTLH